MIRQTSFLLIALFLFLVSCQQNDGSDTEKNENTAPQEISISGSTMGTTYNITYITTDPVNHQPQIDSILVEINQSMSTYIKDSRISEFNKMRDVDQGLMINTTEHFSKVFGLAKSINEATGGAFDPTVMPLVNAWGFGYKNDSLPDSATVNTLRRFIGMNKVKWNLKGRPGSKGDVYFLLGKRMGKVELDFSAIAKGYGVDVIAHYLEKKNVHRYMVEIGGEVRCQGKNNQDVFWRIGIDKPVEDLSGTERVLQSVVELNNRSMATSGNYRNYKVIDSMKVVHTINPGTGYPEINNTLSVTVVAKDCASADAYATAFMVLGMERALPIVTADTNLDAYFIYSDEDGNLLTTMSPGLEGLLKEVAD